MPWSRAAGRAARSTTEIIVAADTVLIVDARTSEPIEWRNVGENPHAVITTRIETYEHLPATKENRALLSVRAQHPDAKLDPGAITIDPDPPGKGEGAPPRKGEGAARAR